MKKIGITGGVGAGKSTVLSLLKKLCNCEIIMADNVAKELMQKGNILSSKAYELFGENAYDEQGLLNRNYIAEIIYNNPSVMKEWENAVHPATNSKILALIEQAADSSRDFVFIEAALLIENNYDKICDEIWYVYADENIRRERLKRERLYSDTKINSIFNGQISDAEFRKHSSFVIDTGGSMEATSMQLENKLEEYRLL